MRKSARLFWMLAIIPLLVLSASISLAADSDPPHRQDGEDRWVPSLAITAGFTIQEQRGAAASFIFEDLTGPPSVLRDPVRGDDLAVSPFVGAALEVMTPALPIPTRPRFFVSGEVLPTFAADRDLALEGDPGCIRGPLVNAPCASDIEGPIEPRDGFGEDALNGEGTRTSAQVDVLVYGANLGVSFPLRFMGRDLRIKPSAAWINYKVDAAGLVVDATCDPSNRCVDVEGFIPGFPFPGFLREVTLMASESKRFNGVGPALDIEMDAGRLGQVGFSLFVGGRAYAVLGDRTISFGASEVYDDQIGNDEAVASFRVDVDPWIFRAHAGIRFQWLGSQP